MVLRNAAQYEMPRGTDAFSSGYLSDHWEMADTYTSSQALTWLPAQVMPVVQGNTSNRAKKILILKEHTVFQDYCQEIHDT